MTTIRPVPSIKLNRLVLRSYERAASVAMPDAQATVPHQDRST